MRTPSVKTLRECFGDKAAEAKRILQMDRTALLELPAGYARWDECYNPPSTADIRLHCLNALGDFHGVESIQTERTEEYADYLNAGDTYAVTLIRWRGNYRVGTLGDFVELSRVRFA